MKLLGLNSHVLLYGGISSLALLYMTFPCSASSINSSTWYSNCGAAFSCGTKPSEIGYPFWGGARPRDCGYPDLELNCTNNNVTIIKIMGHKYQVLGINNNDQTINILRDDLATNKGLCLKEFVNTTLDFSLLDYASSSLNLTLLYGCPSTGDGYGSVYGRDPAPFTCSVNGTSNTNGYVMYGSVGPGVKGCYRSMVVPVMGSFAAEFQAGNLGVEGLIAKGFEVKYSAETKACEECSLTSGRCGYDASVNTTTCICADGSFGYESCGSNETTSSSSSNGKGGKHKTSIAIGVSIGFVALLSLLGGCLLVLQKCKIDPQNRSMEDSLKNYASLVPKRYTYKYIKKMSNSFRDKLGEGGYGTVFKGSFKDGRFVAVKVWKQSKGDGQDFINEVMSISRTSHVNVVPLLGFCFEGHKRALIYEFMPNGSLEKFIQGRYFNKNNQPLSAQKLFEIGVGIARGLEYLHCGCNTRIVHFDIKPHNILLDAEFTPKISDFGLAKSMKQKESIISMSGARGTAGYIAPEVFFRTYGGVSHKSDVYSFGMMVLEMVGCKNMVNENSENSSEMYFPQWIYKQLEQETSIVDCERILNEEEKKLERKMIVVGLWCIQTNPSSRPSMSRVVEMLEGKVELLEVPPMPILCSPPRQQQTTDDDDSVTFLSSSTTYAYAASMNS